MRVFIADSVQLLIHNRTTTLSNLYNSVKNLFSIDNALSLPLNKNNEYNTAVDNEMKRKRVSKDDWIAAALDMFETGGVNNVHVERIAAQLWISITGAP